MVPSDRARIRHDISDGPAIDQSEQPVPDARGNHVALRVKDFDTSRRWFVEKLVTDIEATVAELKRRGVTMAVEPFTLDVIRRRLAFFADPLGNLIELAQPLREGDER